MRRFHREATMTAVTNCLQCQNLFCTFHLCCQKALSNYR